MSNRDRPNVGAMVHVTFEDCCVSGEFTSMLSSVETEADGSLVAIRFTNGVSLSEDSKCRYELVANAEGKQSDDELLKEVFGPLNGTGEPVNDVIVNEAEWLALGTIHRIVAMAFKDGGFLSRINRVEGEELNQALAVVKRAHS